LYGSYGKKGSGERGTGWWNTKWGRLQVAGYRLQVTGYRLQVQVSRLAFVGIFKVIGSQVMDTHNKAAKGYFAAFYHIYFTGS
jgi:hypothetical protein